MITTCSCHPVLDCFAQVSVSWTYARELGKRINIHYKRIITRRRARCEHVKSNQELMLTLEILLMRPRSACSHLEIIERVIMPKACLNTTRASRLAVSLDYQALWRLPTFARPCTSIRLPMWHIVMNVCQLRRATLFAIKAGLRSA